MVGIVLDWNDYGGGCVIFEVLGIILVVVVVVLLFYLVFYVFSVLLALSSVLR